MKLAELDCQPCHGQATAANEQEIQTALADLPGWHLDSNQQMPTIVKLFRFKKYSAAAEFTQKVAALADAQGHHPQIVLEWGQVTVRWWTHTLKGLHLNDFICAAKTDKLYLS
ncbi:4a-hydroxytetrahydrobiopterin dehydratase [Gayadomonas joobiniege]|uniref:4a-hydroxytetrahydrobiopterin dehydratase n=1 Tax=Gayadomonas joobiniege TaxID=1234606 RepID=UPI00036973AC|nr:4a-hydroxytetrahydrobiopterin dehydratase [Gayadomonas joobiniege]